MKSVLTLAALSTTAQALISRGSSCCFHLSSPSGPVGQLSDGQNRIGDDSLGTAEYCISSDGSITDGSGRGCILTPPTTQFQCDEGATPTPGFSINSSGDLEYKGSTNFISCETGQNGGMNIYTTNSDALSQCSTVMLTADSCHSPSPTSGSGGSPSSTSCPTSLSSGNFEFPHLIVPIDSMSPNTASGTSYNGKVTSSVSSIFNFDIPQSDSGKTCTLVFLFPEKADLETSSYTFSGDGKVDVSELSGTASSSTTYNNAPSVMKDLGDITLSPGNSYVVSTFSCPAGKAIAFEMKNAGSTSLDYFQDYNPSP
ncbi:hypothetical protein N7456_011190 [Penicillium angulare]|uniref:Ubiquitin 3 binding protein But2 C-terminal domain-containing protein n=1 Tax=Penicillium angulare TaxID=116970 RepID=A0A9W9ETH2_9EURO|nr:hypothetical protein N7456_011190 [Penicillium angulare]